MYKNEHEIWGTDGAIKVDRAYSIPANAEPSVSLIKNDLKEEITPIQANKASLFELSFNKFSQMIANKENEYDKILNQAKVLEAMRISAKENRKVMLNEIK